VPSRQVSAVIALTGALMLSGLPATAATSGSASDDTLTVPATATASSSAAPAGAPASTTRPTATLSVTSAAAESGAVTLVATSNAKSIQITFRDAATTKQKATEKVREGQAQASLPPGSSSIRVRARATSKLAASPWVEVSPAPDRVPSPGATYWVSKSSKILGKLARYKSVNKYTRDYYLIRSYMKKFEADGGGTLVLGPGRYVISSTIYVPSNTTIRLSEGTTLVKGSRTGTKKFSASKSMFMLIEPSRGKKKGAVGGHNGASGITIAGAGAGRSVIDMANVFDSLAIISGHNRDVTISGITFQRMNNNHFIEMDACADCTITGNEFLDAAGGSRDTAEAINLDTPDPRTHGFGSVWSNQDGTPNERVTISANRFDGMERALGTHNFTAGAYHTDIVVTGNTITSNSDDAIHIMNWANPVFTGNTISSSAGSVGIRACGTTNPTISGNTFDDSAAAVVFRTCRGENGTTAANQVSGENVAALRSNLEGQDLGKATVGVPGQGPVAFDDSPTPAAGVPSQPLLESVVAGDRQVTARWTPAPAAQDAPITAYRIRVRTSSGEDPIQTIDAPPDAIETVVTGLANGTEHLVTVAAVNRVGESPTGDWNATAVTPVGPPSPPLEPEAVSLVSGIVTLTWKAPENDGGQPITGYQVEVFDDPDATQPLPGTPVELDPGATQHIWVGLAEGSTKYLRVRASSSVGAGSPSVLVAVLVKQPPPPWPEASPQGGSACPPACGMDRRVGDPGAADPPSL
jgi:parallel beta-helix repeat protein